MDFLIGDYERRHPHPRRDEHRVILKDTGRTVRVSDVAAEPPFFGPQ